MGSLLERFWEIDFLRGVAILMMIISNLVTDLIFFGVYHNNTLWFYFARITATIFILLVGISLTISYSRAKLSGKHKTEKEMFSRYLKRGLKIFSWGLIVTLVTFVFLRDGFVVFGVLHLIGLSIILAYPLIRLRYWNLLLGIAFIAAGLYLQSIIFGFQWLLWLGFVPNGFYTIDYFPILPWFGVILVGLFLGNILYGDYRRRFSIHDFSNLSVIRHFCFLGRHSLLIYLLHQPIIIASLYLLGVANIGLLSFLYVIGKCVS